jgi:hypothetical protein
MDRNAQVPTAAYRAREGRLSISLPEQWLEDVRTVPKV